MDKYPKKEMRNVNGLTELSLDSKEIQRLCHVVMDFLSSEKIDLMYGVMAMEVLCEVIKAKEGFVTRMEEVKVTAVVEGCEHGIVH